MFDSAYLARGLILYESLKRAVPRARLRVYCMDDDCRDALLARRLPDLDVVSLKELEERSPDLAAVKPDRSRVEYYWTSTPVVCLDSLECDPSLDAITYLDADLRFFSDPQEVFDELGDGSILLTPHRYAERWQEWEQRSGIFNVQFMTFRRDANGLEALRWWRERCIEWCFAREEDGKFGDQKYLDDWPRRFLGVHVVEHPGAGLASWNVEAHRLAVEDGVVRVDGRRLIFFHYHSLRLFRTTGGSTLAFRVAGRRRLPHRRDLVWDTGGYRQSRQERRLVWSPYLDELGRATLAEESARRAEAGLPLLGARDLVSDVARRVLPRPLRRSVARTALVTRARLRRPAGEHESAHDDLSRSFQGWAVAVEMAAVADAELRDPENVPPFRAFRDLIRMLLQDPGLPDPARLLDVGCGVGQYSELLERWYPDRFVYTGCDYSSELVNLARSRYPSRTFVVNDVLDNALDLDAYDVILASALVDVLDRYEEGLRVLLGSRCPHVILHRQRITRSASVGVGAGYAGRTTYRTRLSVGDIERASVAHERAIARSLVVDDEVWSFVLSRDHGTG